MFFGSIGDTDSTDCYASVSLALCLPAVVVAAAEAAGPGPAVRSGLCCFFPCLVARSRLYERSGLSHARRRRLGGTPRQPTDGSRHKFRGPAVPSSLSAGLLVYPTKGPGAASILKGRKTCGLRPFHGHAIYAFLPLEPSYVFFRHPILPADLERYRLDFAHLKRSR